MEWYKIEFEPFDFPLGKHYLGYSKGEFNLVSQGAASLFSSKAIKNNEKLKDFLKDKNYKLVKPQKIYEFMKYRH